MQAQDLMYLAVEASTAQSSLRTLGTIATARAIRQVPLLQSTALCGQMARITHSQSVSHSDPSFPIPHSTNVSRDAG